MVKISHKGGLQLAALLELLTQARETLNEYFSHGGHQECEVGGYCFVHSEMKKLQEDVERAEKLGL